MHNSNACNARFHPHTPAPATTPSPASADHPAANRSRYKSHPHARNSDEDLLHAPSKSSKYASHTRETSHTQSLSPTTRTSKGGTQCLSRHTSRSHSTAQ